jgi:hypothetical protein
MGCGRATRGTCVENVGLVEWWLHDVPEGNTARCGQPAVLIEPTRPYPANEKSKSFESESTG